MCGLPIERLARNYAEWLVPRQPPIMHMLPTGCETDNSSSPHSLLLHEDMKNKEEVAMKLHFCKCEMKYNYIIMMENRIL